MPASLPTALNPSIEKHGDEKLKHLVKKSSWNLYNNLLKFMALQCNIVINSRIIIHVT